MKGYKMWGWQWRSEVAISQLWRRYRRRGMWPYSAHIKIPLRQVS